MIYEDKKVLDGSFHKNEQFLDFSIFTYFILFESDFVNMTLYNYSQTKTVNSKILL